MQEVITFLPPSEAFVWIACVKLRYLNGFHIQLHSFCFYPTIAYRNLFFLSHRRINVAEWESSELV